MRKPDLVDLKQFVRDYEAPTDLLVETVTHCNLDCIMCPGSGMTRPKGRMSWELWRRIVDQVAQHWPTTKLWPSFMGEPLLRGKDIFSMIRHAKDAGIGEISLNTNLTRFKPDLTDALFESRLDCLIISLDGITAGTFEKIRRGASFSTVMENIRLILESKARLGLERPAIVIQFIVQDENAHEEQAFMEYWKTSGYDLRLKIKPRTSWGLAVAPWRGIVNVAQSDRDMPCTWLLRQMVVFWDGRVPKCGSDWDGRVILGDATTQTLEEIWQGPHKAIRDRHMRLDFDMAPCRTCEDWQAGRATWVECHG